MICTRLAIVYFQYKHYQLLDNKGHIEGKLWDIQYFEFHGHEIVNMLKRITLENNRSIQHNYTINYYWFGSYVNAIIWGECMPSNKGLQYDCYLTGRLPRIILCERFRYRNIDYVPECYLLSLYILWKYSHFL